MSEDYTDRRREPRIQAQGAVEIIVEDPVPRRVEGELMDYSTQGFRAQHHDAGIASGTLVRFRHASAQGEAKVMWVRILPGRIESGFFIV